ncbi:MAG: pseudouridine-5'-phosphate glycosidase [Christensenellales bacterium]
MRSVLGLNTDDFPAFYCRKSGFGVDYNAKTPADVAAIAKASGAWGWRAVCSSAPGAGRIRDGFRRDERRDRPCDGDGRRGRREARTSPRSLAHIVELTGTATSRPISARV